MDTVATTRRNTKLCLQALGAGRIGCLILGTGRIGCLILGAGRIGYLIRAGLVTFIVAVPEALTVHFVVGKALLMHSVDDANECWLEFVNGTGGGIGDYVFVLNFLLLGFLLLGLLLKGFMGSVLLMNSLGLD